MHQIKSILILLFFMILMTLMNTAYSQIGYFDTKNLDEPDFDIDAASFRSDADDLVTVELYYKIYNVGLKFFKKKDEFVANYELNVMVLGSDDKQITGASVERKYRLKDYKSTRNPNDFLINLLKLQLEKGKYKLVCKLIDKNSDKIGSAEKTIVIEDLYKTDPVMSDVEFVREVLDADTVRSRFDKGEKRIIPEVSRLIGEDIGQISLYTELYHSDEEEMPVTMKFSIHSSRRKKIYEDENEIVLDRPITRYLKHIPLDDLVPGKYKLSVDLTKRSGQVISGREEEFEIDWSLTALVRNDYDLALEQIKFIAYNEEIETLKNTPQENREKAFLGFWKSKDPTPETPINERMEKYYFRIKHANKFFSTLHKNGWRTDMGMVYIIYGEPDNVERHPFELDQKPYQIWYYYSLSRTFGFVDEIGTGDYELQFPYDGKRGFIDDKMDEYD